MSLKEFLCSHEFVTIKKSEKYFCYESFMSREMTYLTFENPKEGSREYKYFTEKNIKKAIDNKHRMSPCVVQVCIKCERINNHIEIAKKKSKNQWTKWLEEDDEEERKQNIAKEIFLRKTGKNIDEIE